MHVTSELYQSLLQNPLHTKELKLNIAGVEYGMDRIESCSVSGGIFSTPGIGNCASRQIDFVILPQSTIPKQAKVQVFIRLAANGQASEWLPKGVFFFSTRKIDKATGYMTVKGYDAMLKTEQTWLTPDYDEENWPMSQADAVADIAYRIGVEVDSRTVLSSAFPVSYPIDENGDLTMREVLGYIAVSNAGNWVITDEGKLLLIGLGDIPPETSYLVTEYGNAIVLGGVRILV